MLVGGGPRGKKNTARWAPFPPEKEQSEQEIEASGQGDRGQSRVLLRSRSHIRPNPTTFRRGYNGDTFERKSPTTANPAQNDTYAQQRRKNFTERATLGCFSYLDRPNL